MQYSAYRPSDARSLRLHWWTLRILLAGFLAFPLRFTAVGADPDPSAIKADQVDGRPATAAYARRIFRLIKAAWTRSLKQNDEAPSGTVVVHLDVDGQGNVIQPRIVSGPPKEILHRLALLAVTKTELPAMPDDAVKELQGGHLVLDLTFDYRIVIVRDPPRRTKSR